MTQRFSMQINGKSFTQREMDIMACIINGCTMAKAIADLLGINHRTVHTHISNIKQKLECYSLNSIRKHHIESNKDLVDTLRMRYEFLKMDVVFRQILKGISKRLQTKKKILFILSKNGDKNEKSFLLEKFKEDLIFLGMQPFLKDLSPGEPQGHLRDDYDVVVFCDPDTEIVVPERKAIFIIRLEGRGEDMQTPLLKEGHHLLDFQDLSTYHTAFLGFLERIIDPALFKEIIHSFQFQEGTFKAREKKSLSPLRQIGLPIPTEERAIRPSFIHKTGQFPPAIKALSIISFCCVLGIMVATFSKTSEEQIVRADLVIPVETAFLQRPKLINQIKEKLNHDKGINTIAIVGIAGAGKTTLARQYGRLQKNILVWEINAETKNTLISSFDDLAHELAFNNKLKMELRAIEQIQKTEEREKRLLMFIKQGLKTHSNWLLIFDNIDNFPMVKSYLPQDPEIWGNGRVIITTRDVNIQISEYIKSENIIKLDTLTSEETLTLFSKIYFDCLPGHLAPEEKTKAIAFLNNIPAFPLDVSVSAAYLRSTGVSFEGYLQNIKDNSKNFDEAHKSFLREKGGYLKTRSFIITKAIDHIIKVNRQFKKLLILMSTIDSQDIPRELLEQLGDKACIDQFILTLQKHSLVSLRTVKHIDNFALISMHRSTQSIMSFYLSEGLESHLDKAIETTKIADALNNYTETCIISEEVEKIRNMIAHLERTILRDKFFSETDLLMIKNKLSCIYSYSLGLNCEDSMKRLEKAIFYLKKKRKFDYKNIVEIIMLCYAYSELDENAKLKNLLDLTVYKYQASIQTKSLKNAWINLWLGDNYLYIGENQKAQGYLQSTLNMIPVPDKTNAHILAQAHAELGLLYRMKGWYKTAKKHLDKSHSIYTENKKTDYFRFGWLLMFEGYLCQDIGDYEKAIFFLEESGNIYERFFPKAPELFWLPKIRIGNSYVELGHFEKGLSILKKCIVLFKERYPNKKNHPRIFSSVFFAGKACVRMKKIKLAEEYLKEAKEILYSTPGWKNDLKTALFLNVLGELYILKRAFKEAQNTLNEARNIFQENKLPQVFTSLELLADLSREQALIAHQQNDKEREVQLKKEAQNYLDQAIYIVEEYFPTPCSHLKRLRKKRSKIETD